MSTTRFLADYGKRVAGCKKCKEKLDKGEVRMGKIIPNPFVQREDGPPPDMKQYFHVNCLFEMLFKARPATKVIDSQEDVEGWEDLQEEDQEKIGKLIAELVEKRRRDEDPKTSKAKAKKTSEPKTSEKKEEKEKPTEKAEKPVKESRKRSSKMESDSEDDDDSKKKKKAKKAKVETPKPRGKTVKEPVVVNEEKTSGESTDEASEFNLFSKFTTLCESIGSTPKPSEKSSRVNKFIEQDRYNGDMATLFKLLLPGVDQRVYNVKEKQLIKHFSQILNADQETLMLSFKKDGDVSRVIRKAIEDVRSVPTSDWSIQKMDRWLTKLTELGSDKEQLNHFKFSVKRLSPLEMQYLIRLVMKDLRINAGVATIFDGLHSMAHEAFQKTRDLNAIIQRYKDNSFNSSSSKECGILLGTPVLPMLAEACKSVEQAMKKCKNDLFAEIKYDGERIQIHKNGRNFSYFSRSLKPVQKHKIENLHETITHAFPRGDNLILDAEILLVDTITDKPLPFGTLGVHKKEKLSNTSTCLYVFDILRYNEKDLMKKPLEERKELLKKHMVEIKHRVYFSNCQRVKSNDKDHLKTLIWKAISEGLEGLVIKDVRSEYEPGKRHWLKVKKDYLEEGKMADTADLIVLGAYFGTGVKGGILSVFLMGTYDEKSKKYLTVTKCGNGFTDEQLTKINKEFTGKMTRINGNHYSLPSWMKCARGLVPDYVAKDPQESPVWEITGAEFSKSDTHTAGGMSIRFPRVTRIRDDKTSKTATNLAELRKLFEASKVSTEKAEEDELPLYAKEDVPAEDVAMQIQVEQEEVKQDEEVEECRDSGSSSDAEMSSSSGVEEDDDEEEEESSFEDENSEDDESVSESDYSESEDHGDVDSDEERPTKKATARDAKKRGNGHSSKKPACWFGEKCYRKNPEHLKEFSHPSK